MCRGHQIGDCVGPVDFHAVVVQGSVPYSMRFANTIELEYIHLGLYSWLPALMDVQKLFQGVRT